MLNHDKGKTFATVLNTFDELGYKYYYKLINSKDFGIPQTRPRIFVIGFKNHDVEFNFPKEQELTLTMSHFLEEKIDSKYLLSDNQTNFVRNPIKLKKKYTQVDGEMALCQRACQQYNLNGDFVDEKYYLSDKLVQYVMSSGTKDFKLNPSINTEIAKTLLASMHKMHRASIDNYVTGKNGKLRKLTPRECFNFQGFPKNFVLPQNVPNSSLYKQAGNSITVSVVEKIANKILIALK